MTNPQGARGVALGMESAAVLADLVRDQGPDGLAAGLDAWGSARVLPVVLRPCRVGRGAAGICGPAGRWTADGPIGLEALVAAAQTRHPEWMATLGPFFSMELMPAALEPLRDGVREMVRQGWQPPAPDGPSRDQLADLVHAAIAQPVPA